jgi:hypothetical protein
MPPRVPPELQRALNPFLDALRDVVKRSAEAAVDTVLEEVETRAEDVRDRVTAARRNIGRRNVVVVQSGSRPKKRRRRRD